MVLWKLFAEKAFSALFNGVSPAFPKGFQTALVSHSSHPSQTSLTLMPPLCLWSAGVPGVSQCSCALLPTGVLKPQDVMNIHNTNISSEYCAIRTKIYFKQKKLGEKNWEIIFTPELPELLNNIFLSCNWWCLKCKSVLGFWETLLKKPKKTRPMQQSLIVL